MSDKFRRKKEPVHVRLYASITKTEAWKHLSGNSVKVLLALAARDNGTRNGNIGFSCREAGEVTGLSARTCWRCFKELQEKGFIRCTEKGGFSRKVLHSTLWRYTWAAWPEGKQGPTREFEKWKPDENSRLQVLSPPVADCDKRSGNTHAPDAGITTEQSGKCDVSANRQFAETTTLIGYQAGPSSNAELQQRKQANDTSGRFCADLRDSLMDLLEVSEPGIQSRLAKLSGIPAGTLSKFKNGANLPTHHAHALLRTMEGIAA